MIGPLTVDEAREQINLRLREIDELWAAVQVEAPEVRRPTGRLTEMELQVARAAAWSTLSFPEIARERWVSVNTVRSQIKSAYGKLGIHRRADLRSALLDAERIPGDPQPEAAA
ncbi:helix-turn-helix transcriptional regulator [Dactylosporangium roseum]|uniref:Helix-turn-helix transcriptional regulator n=1 Tax=Dactylosporangium roseum TaxID=47989 RepID=A0ABY5ZC58_9ACTN|nr:helix-turn-helix transcriptional regulator [Dactylosporangium roseum]UWZ37919.1 helix-turn-helix transcriptional regulator [Dactylosporangium roseum]